MNSSSDGARQSVWWTVAAIFVVAVGFNYLWELAQSPLYAGMEDFTRMWWHCLLPSLGDGLLVLLIPVFYLAVPIVFGDEYDRGRWPAVLLLAATAVATAASPLHHLYLAFGDDRPYAWFLAAAAALNVVLNLVCIPLFGLVGSASATVVANVVLAATLWVAVGRRTHAELGDGPIAPVPTAA